MPGRAPVSGGTEQIASRSPAVFLCGGCTVRRVSAGRRVKGRGPARSPRRAPVAVCLALGLLAGCSSGGATTVRTAAGVDTPGATVFSASDRRPVPDLSGPTLDGAALRLRDLVGAGVVVVNVWASWCASCRDESAVLAQAARDTAGVRFVGIDEADSEPAARSFVAASGTAYPQVVDADGVLLQRLTLLPGTGIPSTLLLDRQGRMAARVVGPVTRPVLSRLISAVQQEV